jgi:hypothetical protein
MVERERAACKRRVADCDRATKSIENLMKIPPHGRPPETLVLAGLKVLLEHQHSIEPRRLGFRMASENTERKENHDRKRAQTHTSRKEAALVFLRLAGSGKGGLKTNSTIHNAKE